MPQLAAGAASLVFPRWRRTELAEDITEPFPNPHICYTKLPEFQTVQPRAEKVDAKSKLGFCLYTTCRTAKRFDLERGSLTHLFMYKVYGVEHDLCTHKQRGPLASASTCSSRHPDCRRVDTTVNGSYVDAWSVIGAASPWPFPLWPW